MSSHTFTRRAAISITGAATLTPLFGSPALAEPCNALNQLLSDIYSEKATAGSWAITVAPEAIKAAESALFDFESRYKKASQLADQAELSAYLAGINLVVSSTIFVAGLTPAGAVPAFIANVAWNNVLLVAKTMPMVEDPSAIDVAQVGAGRIGDTLSVAGQDRWAMSTRGGAAAGAAGTLIGIASISANAYAAAKALGTSIDRTAAEARLYNEVGKARAALQELRDIKRATSIRQACMDAAAESTLDQITTIDGGSCGIDASPLD